MNLTSPRSCTTNWSGLGAAVLRSRQATRASAGILFAVIFLIASQQSFALARYQVAGANAGAGCKAQLAADKEVFRDAYCWDDDMSDTECLELCCASEAYGFCEGEEDEQSCFNAFSGECLTNVYFSEGSTRYDNPTFSSLPLDWCLTWGADCGAPAAHRFCEYEEGFGTVATRFAKADNVPPTKLIGSGETCESPGCDSFEYIQCTDTRTTTQAPMWNGYRLDFCRFNGLNHPESCGQPAADAYCRNTQGDGYYAMDWTRADNVGPTRIIANNQICSGSWCDGFSEIMCAYDPLMNSIPDDFDEDGVADLSDNCPGNPNPLQENADGDLLGDVCDPNPLEPEHCSDGIDNDGDGLVDEADPGCSWHSDSSEQSLALSCDDGVDNDGDGLVDYPADPSCTSLEGDEARTLQCEDGRDNDADGLLDLDDPDCLDPQDDAEWHLEVGDIVVLDGSGALLRLDPQTGDQTLLMYRPDLPNLFSIAREPSGDLVMTDFNAASVLRVDTDTGRVSTLASGGYIQQPRVVRVDVDGTLLVTDSLEDAVLRVDPVSGIQTIVADDTGDRFDRPEGLLIEPDGSLLVSDWRGARRILRIDPADPQVHQVVSDEPVFQYPRRFVKDAGGDLLVLDSGTTDEVFRVDPSTGAVVETVTSDGLLVDSYGITLEADGHVLVSSRSPGRVVRIYPATGAQQELASGGLIEYPNDLLVIRAECADGLDNDGNGSVDLDDANCASPHDDRESAGKEKPGSRCGLGFEQIVLLPALMWLRRRRNSV
jgi:streptogramin lyase